MLLGCIVGTDSDVVQVHIMNASVLLDDPCILIWNVIEYHNKIVI